MTLVLLLLCAHLIADFYLQKLSWITDRNDHHWRSSGLVKHVLTHLLTTAVALWLAGPPLAKGVVALLAIAGSHYLIDIWKSYQPSSIGYFLADQMAHVLVIIAAALWLHQVSFTDAVTALQTLLLPKVLIVITAAILLCRPISFIIGIALQYYTSQLEDNQAGLSRAGTVIGYLERLLIFGFVLAGQFAGVGFLLAAKSIFRFGDLSKSKDMRLTEYMMLGTLLSFSIALLVGWLVSRLIK